MTAYLRGIARAAAIAPPFMKSELFERVCAHLVRDILWEPRQLLATNLGISPKLRCKIPIAKPSYLFGRPDNGRSERATLALALALSNDCMHFLDVGANEGLFTFAIHNQAGDKLRLHWFEPDRDLHERLERNLAANNIPSEGHRMAAAAGSGKAIFFKNLSDDLSGSLSDHFLAKHDTRPEEVPTVALSEYLETHRLDECLVKVDVEGAGAAVWAGALNGFPSIKYLIMEMLAPEIDAGVPGQILKETDFSAYYIRDFDLVQSMTGEFEYVEPYWNWLFCRMAPAELNARLSAKGFRVVSR